jgi:hypothetical protein
MNYDNVKFHEVLYALGIRGWKILTAPETEEYFLANFSRRTGIGTNDMGEPMAVLSTNPDDFGVTWSQITTKYAELVIEYDNQAYARSRKAEYPTIEECVHAILDDDLTALQVLRQAVKDKYPK